MSRAYRNATEETAEYAKKIEKEGLILRSYTKTRNTSRNIYDHYRLNVCEYNNRLFYIEHINNDIRCVAIDIDIVKR